MEIDLSRSARDVAALSARFAAVLQHIADMPMPVSSKTDELRAKRAQRLAEAAASGQPAEKDRRDPRQ
jgi:hypothetical protein